jgi:4-hydroxythreonine-4-phosphate dehydrogenase
MSRLPVLAITPGEPAGIGPDLCAGMAPRDDCRMVLIADPDMLQQRAEQLGLTFNPPLWDPATNRPGISLLPVTAPCAITPGTPDSRNAAYVLATLETAVAGCLRGEFDALVTGPVHKGIINDAGIPFTGHTEFLAQHSGGNQPVMMLACPGLRVALTTIHLPLSEVSRHITRPHLTQVVKILHADLQTRFGIPRPVILVCGLNPHAGEGGHLGREEIDVITPVLETLRQQGLQLIGPVPADTAFLPAQLDRVDAVLAMYHDQGLPVLKHRDFAHAINVTLGLPLIRTSVDHGTALELAGTGQADPSSLLAAIDMALILARHAGGTRA